jgi:hypothetical protein
VIYFSYFIYLNIYIAAYLGGVAEK